MKTMYDYRDGNIIKPDNTSIKIECSCWQFVNCSTKKIKKFAESMRVDLFMLFGVFYYEKITRNKFIGKIIFTQDICEKSENSLRKILNSIRQDET